MASPRQSRSRPWVLIGVVVLLIGVLISVSGVFPWSRLNCREEEVDINSGRPRYRHYLLYVCVKDRTGESWVSRALPENKSLADWRPVNTFSPGVHYSPHYAFHSAIHHLRVLEGLDQMVPFEPDAKRKVAQHVIELWHDAPRQDVGAYLGALQPVVDRLYEGKAKSVSLGDLPRDTK
jgi:hypothetical protein